MNQSSNHRFFKLRTWLSSVALILLVLAVTLFPGTVFSQIDQPHTITTSSDVDSITQEEFSIFPFRGESYEYYDLFPSTAIIQRHGRMETHVRGSRWEEAGYLFEGINIRSYYNGRPLLHFIPEMMASVKLHKSPRASLTHAPFVFTHQLLNPAHQFQVMAHAETDWISRPNQSVLNTYSYGYQDYTFIATAPLFSPQLRFRLGAEYRYFMDHYRKFWDGFRFKNSFIDPITGEDYSDIIGSEIVIDPGNIPQAHSHDLLVNGLIQGNWGNLDMRLVGALENNYRQINTTPIMNHYNPDHIPESTQQATFFSARLLYKKPGSIHAGIQYAYLNSDFVVQDPILEDQIQRYYFPWPRMMNIYYFEFSLPGRILTNYSKGEEYGHSLTGFLSGKLGNHHWQAGAQWEKRKLRRFQINCSYGSYFQQNPNNWLSDSLSTQFFILSSLLDDNFGYDVYGRKIDQSTEYFDGPVKPEQYGFYVEDSYQTPSWQVRLGVRYDMLSSNTIGVHNLKELHFDYTENHEANYISTQQVYRTKLYQYLSPRLHLSYLLNPQTNFFLSLGRYVQQNQLRDMTNSRLWLQQLLYNTFLLMGYFNPYPVGLEVKPISSYAGSVGIRRAFSPQLSLSGTIFYKYTSDYLMVTHVNNSSSQRIMKIFYLDNLGASSVYGLEMNLKWKGAHHNLWMNYSFTGGKGDASYSNSNYQSEYYNYMDITYKWDDQLDLEHVQQHQLNLLFSYFTGHTTSALWRWIETSALFRLNNGRNFYIWKANENSFLNLMQGDLLTDNYLWTPIAKPEVTTTPVYFTLDVKLSKTFHVGRMGITPYFYIQNLLNRKNVIDLYPRNGSYEYDDYKELNWGYPYPQESWELYEKINLKHRQHFAQQQSGSDLFAHPREFRFGIQVNM